MTEEKEKKEAAAKVEADKVEKEKLRLKSVEDQKEIDRLKKEKEASDKVAEDLQKEKDDREKVQKDAQAKRDAEDVAKEKVAKAEAEAKEALGDIGVFQDLIQDMRDLKTRYTFSNPAHTKRYQNVGKLLDKIITYIDPQD